MYPTEDDLVRKEQDLQATFITMMLVHRGWCDKNGVTDKGRQAIREYKAKKALKVKAWIPRS